MLNGMPATSTSTSVPAKLGNDFAFDAAAAYMCDGHHAYLTGNESDVRVAHSPGNKAMQSVRNALDLQGANYSDFILLSILLLLSAQV